MADDFTDFAASLDASIQHAEKRSKEVDAERLGIDPKEAETQEAPEEATPEEVPAGDEIDESYNDHVEFPDLSQIPHPDDVDETDEDEVAEEAEEETEDEDDEDEDDDDDEGRAPLYGMAAKVPDKRIVGEFLTAYQDLLLEP